MSTGVSRVDQDARLADRAAELARPLAQQSAESASDLLVAVVGTHRVALGLAGVKEVRPPGRVAQVPGSNGTLTGIVGGRGDALPVADLGALLGLPSSAEADDQWVIVLDHRTSPLGLLADSVLDIIEVQPHDLAPPTDPGGLTRALLPDGAVVLDIPALLRDARLSLAPPNPTEESPWPEA